MVFRSTIPAGNDERTERGTCEAGGRRPGVRECTLECLLLFDEPADTVVESLRPSRSVPRCTAASPLPVTASMRRTPLAMLDSEMILNSPMSAVEATCVPPQNSTLNDSSIVTTRTVSPYLSPKNILTFGILRASSIGMSTPVWTATASAIFPFTISSIGADLFRRDLPEVREVEPEPVGRHERSLLMHVLAEDPAQGLVHEMGGGVIPLDVLAPLCIHARTDVPFPHSVGGTLEEPDLDG